VPALAASRQTPAPSSAALSIPGSAPARAAPPTTAAAPPPAAEPGPPPETVLPPLTPSAAAVSEKPLHALHQKATLKWSSLDAYACRIRRREVVAGQQKPEEIIEAQFRKQPFSVYCKWVGAEAKGREMIFVQGQHDNLIHTLIAAGDVPLLAAGSRFKVAPDSLLVKNRTRYPISEAGVGALIERFGKLVDALDRNDPRAGAAKYLGQVKRKEFEERVEVVLQTILPGSEPLLPTGGQRHWCFDVEHGLPVLIVTQDAAGREVEYYCHDRFTFPGQYSDDDFDPERRWAK
jgi:hypothetical protein